MSHYDTCAPSPPFGTKYLAFKINSFQPRFSFVPKSGRRRLLAGTLSWQSAKNKSVLSAVYIAAVVTAVVGTCLVVAICSITLPLLLPSGISFAPLVIGKALFGMVVAAMVTPWAIVKVLR